MTESEIKFAERAAAKLGYTQTAYSSTSGLVGLFCLRDSNKDRKPSGCLVKTQEFGLLFVGDLEDFQLHDLADKQRRNDRMAVAA